MSGSEIKQDACWAYTPAILGVVDLQLRSMLGVWCVSKWYVTVQITENPFVNRSESVFTLINRAAMGRARFLFYTGFIIIFFFVGD